jgi:hypothetical protein
MADSNGREFFLGEAVVASEDGGSNAKTTRKRRRSSSSELSSGTSTSSDDTSTTSSTSSSLTSSSSSSTSTLSSSSPSRASSTSQVELIPPSTRVPQAARVEEQSPEQEVGEEEDPDNTMPLPIESVKWQDESAEMMPIASVEAACRVTGNANDGGRIAEPSVAAVTSGKKSKQEGLKPTNNGEGSNSHSRSSGSIDINWYVNRLGAMKGALAELGLDPHLWAHPNSILFAVLMVTVQESSDGVEAADEADEIRTSEVVQRFRGAKELFEKTLKLEYEGQLKKVAVAAGSASVSSGGAGKPGVELHHFLWKNTGELAEHFAILCDQAEDLYHALPSGLMQALIDELKYQGADGGADSTGKVVGKSTANFSKPTTRGSTAAAGLAQKCPFRQAFMMWVLPTFLQRVCVPYPPAGLLHLSNPPFALGISSSGSSASATRSKFQTKVEDWFSGGTRYTAAHSHPTSSGAASGASAGNKPTAKSSGSSAAPVVKRNVEFASREHRLEKLLLFMKQRGSLVDLKSLGGCRSVKVVVEVDPKTGAQASVAKLSHHQRQRESTTKEGEIATVKAAKPQTGIKLQMMSHAPVKAASKPSLQPKATAATALLNALTRFPTPLTPSLACEEEEDEGEEEAGWLTHSVGSVSETLSVGGGAPGGAWWKELERLLLDGLSPADRAEVDPRGVATTTTATAGTKPAKQTYHGSPARAKQTGRWVDALKASIETHPNSTSTAVGSKNSRPQGRPRTTSASATDGATRLQNLKPKPSAGIPSSGGIFSIGPNPLTYELNLASVGDSSPTMDVSSFLQHVVTTELKVSVEAEMNENSLARDSATAAAAPLGVAVVPSKVARPLFQHLLSVCRLPFHGKDREEKDRLWQFIKCCHEATYFSDSGFHNFLAEVVDELILTQQGLKQTFAQLGGFRVLADWLKLAQARLADHTSQRIDAIFRRHRDLDEGIGNPLPSTDSSSVACVPMPTLMPFLEVRFPAFN